jgi:hypothetical protein
MKKPAEVSAQLKKTAETKNSSSSSAHTSTRTSQWWVCMVGVKLYFYQYYGDSRPRLITDMSEATAVLTKDKLGSKSGNVNLIHKDARLWPLQFGSSGRAENFLFALAEEKKHLEQQQPLPRTSSGSKNFLSPDPSDFGFYMPIH